MSLVNLNKLFKGLRFRLTFVYSTLFGLIISIFAYIIANQYIQSAYEDFDSALLNYAIDLSDHIKIDHSGYKVSFKLLESELKKEFPFILGQTFYFIRSIEGKILTKSKKEIPFAEIPYNKDLALDEDYTYRFLSFGTDKETVRAVNLKITNDQGKPLILQVATPSTSLEERNSQHVLFTSISVPLIILVSSFISYLIAGNALTPIKMLTDTANSIAVKNLSLRVPVLNTGDEVEELSKTFNNLLERMEKSFKAQENFVSDASHQLNTPLAIIKGELDVLESKDRSLVDNNKFHQSLREELARLIEVVEKMLLVSRVESGQESFIFIPIRLDELLLGTSARLSSKARDKKITLRFNISEELMNEAIMIKGEKQLLDCLFENLLDNAIKYSPYNSTVSIDIKASSSCYDVSFCDQGPGIAAEDLQDILTKRFQRGTGIGLPGTGIGLSIAYQIAEYHKAKITYQRLQPQGSHFMVSFPKQDS